MKNFSSLEKREIKKSGIALGVSLAVFAISFPLYLVFPSVFLAVPSFLGIFGSLSSVAYGGYVYNNANKRISMENNEKEFIKEKTVVSENEIVLEKDFIETKTNSNEVTIKHSVEFDTKSDDEELTY